MENNIDLLKFKFKEIKKMGWFRTDTTNYGVIGEKIEELIGLSTNDFQIPDFGNIEIKTKSNAKFSYISLFNCAPTGPHYHEIEVLKDKYGYPDRTLKDFKVLSGDVFADKVNKIGIRFSFKLNVDEKNKKIMLHVHDNHNNTNEETTYWDFDELEEKLIRKLTYLALISVRKKVVGNILIFKYVGLNIYKLKGFETFIDLMKHGLIKITFKVGIFKDQKKLGKIHDRGTSFSIDKDNIKLLFDKIE